MYSRERRREPKDWRCPQLPKVKRPSQEYIGQVPMSVPQGKAMAYHKLHYSLKLPKLGMLNKKNSNPIHRNIKMWH